MVWPRKPKDEEGKINLARKIWNRAIQKWDFIIVSDGSAYEDGRIGGAYQIYRVDIAQDGVRIPQQMGQTVGVVIKECGDCCIAETYALIEALKKADQIKEEFQDFQIGVMADPQGVFKSIKTSKPQYE
eukprot:CAMPEP_0167779726 /NCGR_PEP_ID=MMETSP0111_2-20121227/4963_1 /TAXON_ID=91324 /ORGANISM="Lotharella globosa, Strain CCCM811" /LENGTH=128 /DNA_ID=CAMNT_0007670161 /DNA_START=111 /DNA_END=494 /DNA_ORIENTATION=-